MKLYNVFNLYVVKKQDKYFICKSTNDEKIYIEFFTKEKIKVRKREVEPLTNYYSILGVKNYTSGEVLKLSKKEILLKYLEINQKEDTKEFIDGEEFLRIEEENKEKANKIYEDCLKESKKEKLINSSVLLEVWEEQQEKIKIK